MQETLIIKTGAAGDVVRTTSVLNVLEGNVTWIIAPENKPLLPDALPRLQLIPVVKLAGSDVLQKSFDLVLSLEETPACAAIASNVNTKKLTGVHLKDGNMTYTEDAAGWFDMSLISRKGKQIADQLKLENQFSFQHFLFEMIGKKFSGEPYIIYKKHQIKKNSNLLGIESRSGRVWPNKAWSGYNELRKKIMSEGFEVRTFTHKENLRDYLDEIASCSFIISGDSLPMHVAMAYQIPAIAIFNCTPPNEIYDYGSLTKIVSPLLRDNLYDRKYKKEIVNSIDIKSVYRQFKLLCSVK